MGSIMGGTPHGKAIARPQPPIENEREPGTLGEKEKEEVKRRIERKAEEEREAAEN